MEWNFFSFFLNNEDSFLELNPNILETNVINILILVGLLIYGYQVSFRVSLADRQEQIIQTIENAQKDVVSASNYYTLAEQGFTQSLFWLQSWKSVYEKEKVDSVNTKYKQVKIGLLTSFLTTNTLISTFENKAFLSLQRYIVFITAGRILRKFFFLSETEQAQLVKGTISKLGGTNT